MSAQKRALVLGAGGFIGSHLLRRLKAESFWVRGADLKLPDFSASAADDFVKGDLRDPSVMQQALGGGTFDEIYQLAADMGGAGYIFTGDNDAAIMTNSVQINLNLLANIGQTAGQRVFYSSSACIYPAHNQTSTDNPTTAEHTAFPADPDSEYGWEKLFSERLYLTHARNFGLKARIARFHNIFGPEGTWQGGKEKAPAAMCRKVAEASDGGEIEIWGDGEQTRSFLYIDECLEGVTRLIRSEVGEPLNIGSDETVTINQLAQMAANIAGKTIKLRHIPGPLGVRGRTSDNQLIRQKLDWVPDAPLKDGLAKTYAWIDTQVRLTS
jgi:nucleoside-diphosphate-sugar epimerase